MPHRGPTRPNVWRLQIAGAHLDRTQKKLDRREWRARETLQAGALGCMKPMSRQAGSGMLIEGRASLHEVEDTGGAVTSGNWTCAEVLLVAAPIVPGARFDPAALPVVSAAIAPSAQRQLMVRDAASDLRADQPGVGSP
jgi:hypothetical protein